VADTNGPPHKQQLQRFLRDVRVRVVSEPGTVPVRLQVNGIEMSEGYFRFFLRDAGLPFTVEDVVGAVRGKGR
jgi:hypothetical protein